MKASKNREVEVVENIIRILNECLAISLKNKRREEAKRTINDIHMCKQELRRLKEAKLEALDKVGDEAKEPAKDAAF